jgi:hypothetical protein
MPPSIRACWRKSASGRSFKKGIANSRHAKLLRNLRLFLSCRKLMG